MERGEIGVPDKVHSARACPKSDRAPLQSTRSRSKLDVRAARADRRSRQDRDSLDDAPVGVLDALKRSTQPMLEAMIEDGPAFALPPNFLKLANAERTFLRRAWGAESPICI